MYISTNDKIFKQLFPGSNPTNSAIFFCVEKKNEIFTLFYNQIALLLHFER